MTQREGTWECSESPKVYNRKHPDDVGTKISYTTTVLITDIGNIEIKEGRDSQARVLTLLDRTC